MDPPNILGRTGCPLRGCLGPTVNTRSRSSAFAKAILEGVALACLSHRRSQPSSSAATFGPIRGARPDRSWQGWWGDNLPYHAPTYVLTHQARPSIELEGGNTSHVVIDGIESALRQARAVAGEKDVKIGGGVATRFERLFGLG